MQVAKLKGIIRTHCNINVMLIFAVYNVQINVEHLSTAPLHMYSITI